MRKEELEVLNKGLSFSVAPKWLPFEELICNLEDGIHALKDEDKYLLRKECVIILRKSKAPKCNLNHEKLIALKSLRNNDSIVILIAEKGGETMVMNRNEYIAKMKDHLYNNGSYKKLKITLFPKLQELSRKPSRTLTWIKE